MPRQVPATVWVFEPNRDDWVEGVYATLEAACKDLGLEDVEVITHEGVRQVRIGIGYLSEWEVQE